MKSNYDELIKQFLAACGTKHIDLKSKSFLEEFSNWLKERKEVGEKYVSIISNFELFKDNSKCAEVNKGIEDSVTLPYHTKLLTPYIDVNRVDDPNRVIDADFSIYKNNKLPIISTKDVKIQVIPNNRIMTYMTQNPYDSQMLEGWNNLQNSGRNNIVVGVYGKEYDKDKSKKKDMLLRFRKQLDNNFREIEYVLNDEYFCVIGTKQKTR